MIDENHSAYQLLDFGSGRKLERFGEVILDRPCPAAITSPKFAPKSWIDADLKVDSRGKWIAMTPTGQQRIQASSAGWSISLGLADGSNQLTFGLRPTPFGHVGLFPEQFRNWNWLDDWSRSRAKAGQMVRCLNLFAYTGGSTLAVAAAAAEKAAIVHVDASQPAVRWARENAAASRLHARPVRWIVDDASKFVARELKRQRNYDLIILDPPSFGHGPKGTRWDMRIHLAGLLRQCFQLLDLDEGWLLLTGHSDVPDDSQCVAMLREAAEYVAPVRRLSVETGRLSLTDLARRDLDAGFFVRARVS